MSGLIPEVKFNSLNAVLPRKWVNCLRLLEKAMLSGGPLFINVPVGPALED